MGELKFVLPLDRYKRISDPYGMRIDPVKGGLTVRTGSGKMRNPFAAPLKFHGGIDYAVGGGTHVKASERGRVVKASKNEALGELVIIDHTPNAVEGRDRGTKSKYLYTMYAHLSKYDVKLGDDVKKGQRIASSGKTGSRSTGYHLHFSIIESDTRLHWGATGPTGYASNDSLFKDPEGYYNRPITVKGTLDDLTAEQLSIIRDSVDPRPVMDLERGVCRVDWYVGGIYKGATDVNNKEIDLKLTSKEVEEILRRTPVASSGKEQTYEMKI